MKNKLFKGAVAGAAGVALLLGGAGTFALWNHTANIGSTGTITSGHLYFDSTTNLAGAWYLNDQVVTNLNTVFIVPGDVLEYRAGNVSIVAHGTNLVAQLGIDFGDAVTHTASHEPSSQLLEHTAPTFLVNGDEATVGADNTATFELTGVGQDMTVVNKNIIVRFAFATEIEGGDPIGQEAQGGQLNLSDINLTLQQVPHADHL